MGMGMGTLVLRWGCFGQDLPLSNQHHRAAAARLVHIKMGVLSSLSLLLLLSLSIILSSAIILS